MRKHILAKTGKIAAARRQLGHKYAAYSKQYSSIKAEELRDVINRRGKVGRSMLKLRRPLRPQENNL